MKRSAALLAGMALLSLSACGDGWTQLPSITKSVTLLDVSPPKHFSVTLRDNTDGSVIKDIYVSKRCSGYERIPVGSTFDLEFDVLKNNVNGKVSIAPNYESLQEQFCS